MDARVRMHSRFVVKLRGKLIASRVVPTLFEAIVLSDITDHGFSVVDTLLGEILGQRVHGDQTSSRREDEWVVTIYPQVHITIERETVIVGNVLLLLFELQLIDGLTTRPCILDYAESLMIAFISSFHGSNLAMYGRAVHQIDVVKGGFLKLTIHFVLHDSASFGLVVVFVSLSMTKV